MQMIPLRVFIPVLNGGLPWENRSAPTTRENKSCWPFRHQTPDSELDETTFELLGTGEFRCCLSSEEITIYSGEGETVREEREIR